MLRFPGRASKFGLHEPLENADLIRFALNLFFCEMLPNQVVGNCVGLFELDHEMLVAHIFTAQTKKKFFLGTRGFEPLTSCT